MNTVAQGFYEFYDVNQKKALGIVTMVEAMIKTSKDVEEFFVELNKTRTKHVFFGLSALQTKRRKENQITKSEFIKQFEENAVSAVEGLFFQTVKKRHINEMVKSGITPGELFDLHKENITKNFLVLIKENNAVMHR
ncbi:hypothetical protein ABES25_10065 [Bacillus gobiensis]|uniref:hypothetical protein n=1 Tax=Bacillus gobiensis TaxID=1441095 RepID=UPI003D1CAA36